MCKKLKYMNPEIDKCMRPLIRFLKSEGYKTKACCCGHNKYPMTIVVEDNRTGNRQPHELLTGIKLDRLVNYYKKDTEGYYYIPEVTYLQ